MKIRLTVLGLALGLFALAPLANATPIVFSIGGSTCASCQGLDYTLTVSDPDAGVYTATLLVTGTYTGPDSAQYISAVDFKVASDITAPSLFSAPDGWSPLNAYELGVNNSGCGAGGSGFACANATPGGALADLSSGLEWVFHFTLADGATLFSDGAHIGAKFNNEAGTLNGVVMSETATSVPEPGSMFLVGVGLLGFGFLRRR